jgi:hypothetical protein
MLAADVFKDRQRIDLTVTLVPYDVNAMGIA